MTSTTPPEIAAHAESLIPQFRLTRLLNQDQAGRRISLLGTINDQPAILVAERAAFSTTPSHLTNFSTTLSKIKTLGANDIYFWFLAHTGAPPAPTTTTTPTEEKEEESEQAPPADLKLNLIYPSTPKHIQKYSSQGLRIVTETPQIYHTHIRPYMQRQRDQGRLNWILNILEGRSEQSDVIYREPGAEKGFLLIPDLNWDRKTVTGLHLLGIVERRDVWSVRDLRKRDAGWVRYMKDKMLEATVGLYPQIETDQLKLYVHYQPTYYHFHIHIVHVALEAGSTQATGKALGLENIISQLETLQGGEEAGMADVSLTYHLGEQSEIWEKIYLPLKEGRKVEG